MSSLFDDLKQGLEEAIEFEKGNCNSVISAFTVPDISDTEELDKIEFIVTK